MEKNRFLPIILGSDENAYGNARLFAEAYGIKPLMLCKHRLIPTEASRLFDRITIENFDRSEVFKRELLRLLEEKKRKYEAIVVVPCSDYYINLLSEHAADFEKYICNRVVPYDLLCKLNTKDRFYELCDRFGVDYPKTLIVSPEKREGALQDSGFVFPVVVKPENSNAAEYLHCDFKGKKKVFFVNSREEYREIVKEMNRSDYRGNLILQEFIPGGDDAMRVVNTYSGNDGKTRLVSLGQPVLEEYSPSTLGNYAAIISRSEESLCRRISEFLDRLHYTGFANFDLKYDTRTGKYMMFEINCRPGRSSFYVRGAGCNMMKLMTEDAVFGMGGGETVYTDTRALWTAVPKGVLMKYVKNDVLKAEVKELWREGKVSRTLFCPGDMSFERRLRICRYYYGYYRRYSQYYFDKENQKESK